MLRTLRHLWLGVMLIATASALLLVSDLGHRKARKAKAQSIPRIGILQFASNSLLDDTVRGMVVALKDNGFVDGSTADIKILNASGDHATLSTMAQELADGNYSVVLTASTLAMQAVANANKSGRVVQVFGAVTDPYGAGVGITGAAPDQHPPHLVGVGTFQPVARAIETAHALNPDLKVIGTVWNPNEINSESCVEKARAKCAELGIELLEANASHTSEVAEAVRSVLSRGVDCIWPGTDNISASAISAIVAAAHSRGVPVFTSDPADVAKGVFFGLGASYFSVGQKVGAMAAEILKGRDPASYEVRNVVPEVLALREDLLERFDGWKVTPAIRVKIEESSRFLDSPGVTEQAPDKMHKVSVLYYSPVPIFERYVAGMRDELSLLGFREGRNLEFSVRHVSGEMSMLPQMAATIAGSDADVIVPLSTPCLVATLSRIKDRSIVFGAVSAPLEAGAGKSFEDHLANVTGAVWTAPSEHLFRWLRELYPDCRQVGLAYNDAEVNSIREEKVATAAMAKYGMTPVVRTVSSSSEIAQALDSLFSEGVDAVFGMGNSTVVSSLSVLVNACKKQGLPLVVDDASLMGSGGLLSVGPSPTSEGRRAARIVARVLRGESPASIPLEPSTSTETAVDLAVAKNLKLNLPAALLQASDIFLHSSAARGRPQTITMVNLDENPLLVTAEDAFVSALEMAGFQPNVDFSLRKINAHGDLSQLPQTIDAALTGNPDLLVTLTTPALIAAAHKKTNTPHVFMACSAPANVGIFQEGRPANVTGVHDDPQLGALLDMVLEVHPDVETVGSVHDPAQPNSMISVERLRAACRERSIHLVEATANSSPELPTATQSVLQRKAEVIIISADNLAATGFAGIEKAASAAGVPIFTTDPELLEMGAEGAFGVSYEAWGRQAGRLAAKVLAGVTPSRLPIETAENRPFLPTAAPKPTAQKQEVAPPTPRTEPWEIRAVRYNDTQFSEEAYEGFVHGLKKNGFRPGQDFNIKFLNAQGDMATLGTIVTAIQAETPDLVVAISTPALQATLRQITGIPIVYTSVASGIHAGAGETNSRHRPNVAGVDSRAPFEGMLRLVRASVPGVRKVGTLFAPAEVNSVLYRDWFSEILQGDNLELVAEPLNSSAEASLVIAALLREDIQVVCQISDNLTRPALGEIARQADDRGIPVFCFDSSGVDGGATLALAIDHFSAAGEAAEVALQVLQGASPADIPFRQAGAEVLRIDFERAERFGLTLPRDAVERARQFQAAH